MISKLKSKLKRRELPVSDISEPLLSVTDVKQFFYCPRILYFDHVLHLPPKMGSQQEESHKVHEELERKETRRKGAVYYSKELQSAEKFFRVSFVSKKLNLYGTLDCLIKAGEEYIPVDYKNMHSNKGKPWPHHKYQLTAYALLIEETYDTIVKQGYINYLLDDKIVLVEMTPSLKAYVRRTLPKIEEIVKQEKLPPIRVAYEKCSGECGYRWVCKQV